MKLAIRDRWTKAEKAMLDMPVVLYQRNRMGEIALDSVCGGVVRELRTDYFGDHLVLIERGAIERGARLQELFYIGSRRHLGGHKSPFTYFALEDEELA